MSHTTIVLPLSRQENLSRVLSDIEMLDCPTQTTSLVIVVDGPATLLKEVEKAFDELRFTHKKAALFKADKKLGEHSYQARRPRIAHIHNFAKTLVPECDYVFCIEDDGVLPNHALRKLQEDLSLYPYAGVVSGVEVGRHGISHLGLWKADNVYDPQKITSLPAVNHGTIEEVDAAGLYACLMRRTVYVNHDFKPFDYNVLGPDVDLGINLRQQGYKNYVDHDVVVGHMTRNRVITPSNSHVQTVSFEKINTGHWRQRTI